MIRACRLVLMAGVVVGMSSALSAQGALSIPSAHGKAAPAIAVAEAASPRLGSDDVLRRGMDAIRSAVRNNHTLITHRRFPPAMAAGFSSFVRRQVDEIRQSSSLPDATRQRLNPLLEDMAAGASLCLPTADSSRAIEGLLKITTALELYGELFDHPGWQRLQEQ